MWTGSALLLFAFAFLCGLSMTTAADTPRDGMSEEKDTKSFLISRCCAFYAAGAAGAGVLGAAVALPASLGLLGFGAVGPAAGSVAAAWQATMGGTVIAGGLFSTLQGIAMAGVGGVATISSGVVGAVGIVQFCDKLEDLGLCSPVTTLLSKL